MATIPEKILSPEEEQEKFLNDASLIVKSSAYHMKRALDSNRLKEALKHAATMISVLRGSDLGPKSELSPKNYYDLYMKVFNELNFLEAHFREENRRGQRMIDLYELVQHASNVLPRLYLLITVGSVYIRSKEAPARDILRDMVEMCRGVQHPTRGLFLRNYLSQLSKDKLPDKDGEYEGTGGTVKDSIEFILQNFVEMNKLWVRMQHQGPLRDRDKRERERRDLRLLVGTNLVRLSQLDGVDLELYKTVVLPRILEQVINCKDPIAQEYLMDIIIQVFPDENHLHTLEPFLTTCTQLQPGVDVRAVLVALLDRLSKYAAQHGIADSFNAFGLLSEYVAKIINSSQPAMELTGVLSLQVSLLNFALKCYPDKLEFVDQILGTCRDALSSMGLRQLDDTTCVRQLLSLLTIPLTSYKNILTIVELKNYSQLMAYLPFKTRKTVALSIVENVVKNRTTLEEPDKVDILFDFAKPLIKDADGQPDPDTEDMDDFEEEQNLVARIVHLLRNPDTDTLFKIYTAARKHFGQGGPRRIKFTLIPLILAVLKLAPVVHKRELAGDKVEMTSRKMLQFALDTARPLIQVQPALTLRLYLQCAQAASASSYGDFVYEFVTQAFVIFEEDISDSKAQFAAITLFIGTLLTLQALSAEEYESLCVKTTQSSAKLLKKPDQCRAIYLSSHLFWRPEEGAYRDGRRVLECLKRALKIADSCVASGMHVQLFVEILNQYIYYFEERNEAITVQFLAQLIDLINEHVASNEAPDPAVQIMYQNTLAHIRLKKASPDAERYRDLPV